MQNDSCLYVLDSFDIDYLNILIDNDETLYDAIMISFQLKVLEQLLLFCGEHDANTLHIFVNEDEAPELEIYHNFSSLQEKVPRRRKVKIVVPAKSEVYDHRVDLQPRLVRSSISPCGMIRHQTG